MTNLAEFARHKDELKRQLLRRIGYTGGMFDLGRFVRIIEYIEPLLPKPQALVAKEVASAWSWSTKYTNDMLDVLRAMKLVQQAGPRMSLSTTGRALYALSRLNLDAAVRALLLCIVIDRDGDYSLNLLHLLRESPDSAADQFFPRILQVIAVRKAEVDTIPDKFIRDVLFKYLSEVEDGVNQILGRPSLKALGFRQRVIAAQRQRQLGRSPAAINAKRRGQPTDTVRHTTRPRRGWLQQLGLVEPGESSRAVVTELGSRLWDGLERLSFLVDRAVRVPYDEDLLSALNLEGLPSMAKDGLFRLASLTYGGRADDAQPTVDEFIERGRQVHQWTKLRNFKQSHAEAIYLAMASSLAIAGRVFTREQFRELLQSAALAHPSQVYRLSQRRPGLGYVVFK